MSQTLPNTRLLTKRSTRVAGIEVKRRACRRRFLPEQTRALCVLPKREAGVSCWRRRRRPEASRRRRRLRAE